MKLLNNRPLSRWLLAILLGFVGLWLFHLPQFASKFDKFPGDRGDARLVAYLMEHWHHVFQGAASWRSPEMFYPAQGTLGYADLLLGYGIVHSIFRSLGFSVFGAAETTIILFNFLNYLVCFVLLYKVLRFNLAASIAGAMFFAFNSPKLVQLPHSQLQPIVFLPLAVIGIVLFVQKRETLTQLQAFGLLALAALSLDMQLLTGFYPGWFFIFWSLLFLLLTLCFETTRNIVLLQVRKFWPALAGGVAVIIAGFIPFVLAYLPVMRSIGGRPYDEIRPLIPVPWSFLLMSPRNYVWGRITSLIALKHSVTPELNFGIGLVPSLAWLGVIAFVILFLIRNAKHAEFQPRRMQMLFLSQLVIATCAFYLIGMTYWHGFSPWRFVYAYVPGAQAIRAVSRYALVLALPMSIAFAFTLHLLMQQIARQRERKLLFGLLFIVIALGLFEQFQSKEGFDGFSIRSENAYLNRLAQALPNDCSAFYTTVKPTALHNMFEYQLDAALVSMLKGVPTLNGYSGQLPPGWYLWDMIDPGYENNVKRWIDERQIKGKVCKLFIRETTAPEDIADPEIFVRQQYLDMLRRLPDGPGLQTWLTVLNHCTRNGGRGADKSCDRESVSMAILQSAEFAERSEFVIRLYLAALGRLPTHKEFLADRERLVTAPAAQLTDMQAAVVEELMRRRDFNAMYPLEHEAFVDKLLATAGNKSINRAQLIAELDSWGMTRDRIVHVVVNDEQTIKNFQNQAFVLMQFFGNLDRDPQAWEYRDRLDELNITGDRHRLVSAFLYSTEYRKRFGYVN